MPADVPTLAETFTADQLLLAVGTLMERAGSTVHRSTDTWRWDMGIFRFIQRKYEDLGLRKFGLFGDRPAPSARLCEFGHVVFSGNNLCNYGHHAA